MEEVFFVYMSLHEGYMTRARLPDVGETVNSAFILSSVSPIRWRKGKVVRVYFSSFTVEFASGAVTDHCVFDKDWYIPDPPGERLVTDDMDSV